MNFERSLTTGIFVKAIVGLAGCSGKLISIDLSAASTPISILALAVWLLSAIGVAAAHSAPMTVTVDAREATRGILHVHETIPVAAGPLKLVYPKWIPGEHAPNGPIVSLASLVVSANGAPLAWRRDPIELYSFSIEVPPGTSSVDVNFDFLATSGGPYSARLVAPDTLVITWNDVLLAPAVDDYRTLQIVPSIQLPGADWQFGTALDVTSRHAATINFAPLSEEMLVDSPLDAGRNVKKIGLGSLAGAPVELDVFADTPAQLAISEATIAKFRNLVKEMEALYAARHFDHYTFLLTVSSILPGEGIEHHQSSDDGADADFLTDPGALAVAGDLLPHEFNHSWDGKFRRPADLATPNLQLAMQDDLLWVYEGMTQFYGGLQAERSGLWSRQQWFDMLASMYAVLDSTSGRRTRSLLDTAVSAPFLYASGHQWQSARRGVDFYPEGALMWLEVDVTIRRLSHGRRSLDDMARAFFGRDNSGPQVMTYERGDVVAALNAVQPYDWRRFFEQRVDAVAAHPPDPFTPAGWHLVYESSPTAFDKLRAGRRHALDARYSLGIVANADGTIVDVIAGSPSANAGLGPGEKIVAIGGRALDSDAQPQLDAALNDAQRNGRVLLLVLAGGVYRDVTIACRLGPRYPHLERIAGSPDLLVPVAAPRRADSTTAR